MLEFRVPNLAVRRNLSAASVLTVLTKLVGSEFYSVRTPISRDAKMVLRNGPPPKHPVRQRCIRRLKILAFLPNSLQGV